MNLDFFNEIERKFNLLDYNIDGYYFWIYSRAEIGWTFEKEMLGINHPSTPVANKNRTFFKSKLIKLKNALFHSFVNVKHCDLLVLNHQRRVLVDNVFDCIYTDDLVENYGNSVVFEEPYQEMHFHPIRTKNIVYTDFLDILCYLYCGINQFFLSSKFKRNRDTILKMLEEPFAELNKAYNTNVKPADIINSLIYGLYMYKIEKIYFKKQILRYNPKAIIELVSYKRQCMIVNELAKDMNIPTIELQHGTIGKEHIAYNYPKDSVIKQFPEYIFLFSEFWKSKTRFPISEKNQIATGFPYLEKMAQKYQSSAPHDHIVILFLSSEPIGDRLSKVAVELRQKLDKQKYKIIYKLHPGEYSKWRQWYPHLSCADIEVIDTPKINLYKLFSISNIQVSGFNSTTIFEGLYFSLPTFLLKECITADTEELCSSGLAKYFSTSDELIDYISSNITFTQHSIWKSNSLINMTTEINNIIKQHNRCK